VPELQEVPLAEAAKRLGLSPDALRKRLARGTMQGFKRDEQWYMLLPTEPTGHVQDNGRSRPEDDRSAPDTDLLVETLRDQVAFLRKELETRTEELHRKDVLLAEQGRTLAELARRMPELPAESQAPQDARESPQARESAEQNTRHVYVEPGPQRRPWWRFWG
jgi:hypothetical protein